jgi:hypothetical protein
MNKEHTHTYVRIHRDVITGKYGSIDICLCGAVKLKLNANTSGEVLNRVD